MFRRVLQFEGKVYSEAVELWVRTALRDIGVMFSMARLLKGRGVPGDKSGKAGPNCEISCTPHER